MRRQSNPFFALLLCYLTVTVGYVYAALYLAIVLLGCLVEAMVARDRRAFLRALYIGLFSGLVVITVYLPGILTAPVTVRLGWEVIDAGQLTVEPTNIVTSMLPSPRAFYLAWCLPLLALIHFSCARLLRKELTGVLVVTVLLLAWVLGPSQVGPIRWPVRVAPALMVALIVLLVVLVARSLPDRPSRMRWGLSVAWVVAAAYVVVARNWETRSQVLVGAVVVIAGLLLSRWGLRRSAATFAIFLGCWTTVVFTVQHALHPAAPSFDRHMPAAASGYLSQLSSARGDIMVIGHPDYYDKSLIVRDPSIADDLLIASSWFLNPQSVQNVYSTISFPPFANGSAASTTAARVPLR